MLFRLLLISYLAVVDGMHDVRGVGYLVILSVAKDLLIKIHDAP